jgi:hypothetical protein
MRCPSFATLILGQLLGDKVMTKEEKAAKNKAWREANKEKVKADGLAYREANREKIKAKMRAWWAANSEELNAKKKVYVAANQEAVNARNKAYRDKNKEKAYERTKVWRKANPEKRAEHDRKYARAHPELEAAKHKRWRDKYIERVRAEDKNPDIIRERKRTYSKVHRGVVVAAAARRSAAEMNRTPKWLTENDIWMIKEVYSLSALRTKLTGVKWHVDHIIPLRGERVSGLHVPSNLQVITARENCIKNNRYGA